MRLVLSRRATRRLAEIADHIQAKDPAAAGYVKQAIRDALDLLSAYPNVGRSVQPNVRLFVVPRLPYLIYYQVDDASKIVTIVTIRHAARRRLM